MLSPTATPDRDRVPHDREPGQHDINFKQWDHPDWEVSATSESQYVINTYIYAYT